MEMARTLRFFNTLPRVVEEFVPIEAGKVRLYTCGPTVYNYAHIGNLRTYIFEDVLRRTLEFGGFEVRHVMNITDVGHLESDSDQGEDKMSLASVRERTSPWEIARYYEDAFYQDCAALNIVPPHVRCRATEHIQLMIDFVQGLEQSGHAYAIDGNVYFDISRYRPYPELARLPLEQLMEGARVDPDPRKRNPLDFVLWFSQSKFPNQIMKWDSPWGNGFPGWHIECSAMASKYLGERLDIHCGGIDHIPVHHTNERAQSEARFGHRWVNTWMHAEFLIVDAGGKMSKSAGEFLTLRAVTDRGFEPAHYRFFCLGTLYRHPLRFSWEALRAARNSYENLKNRVVSWKLAPDENGGSDGIEAYRSAFWEAMSNDLHTPTGLSVLWDVAKDTELGPKAKLALLSEFDRILGIGVDAFRRPAIAPELAALISEREAARQRKEWSTADAIRNQLLEAGIQLKDTVDGTDWYTTVQEE